jgi:hypothetical protein
MNEKLRPTEEGSGYAINPNAQLYSRLRKTMLSTERCSEIPDLIADTDLAEQYLQKNDEGWLGLVIYLASQSKSDEEFNRRLLNCMTPLSLEFRTHFAIIKWLHYYSFAGAKRAAKCPPSVRLLVERTWLYDARKAGLTAEEEAMLAELEDARL